MYVHSFQSMGTLDGPGIRFVVFTQGCPLRCIYCQNPDTWQMNVGQNISVEEIFEKVKRYKAYFSNGGGLTVSGGEPMLQQEELKKLFTLLKKVGINTAFDPSGVVLDTCDFFRL
ncbi:MAG: radical SAM protein, partial [Oscillospiraceae bacterium]